MRTCFLYLSACMQVTARYVCVCVFLPSTRDVRRVTLAALRRPAGRLRPIFSRRSLRQRPPFLDFALEGDKETESSFKELLLLCVSVYVCVCTCERVCVFVTVKLKSSYSMLPVNTPRILYFSAFF